jgi:polyphosphate glucokinase
MAARKAVSVPTARTKVAPEKAKKAAPERAKKKAPAAIDKPAPAKTALPKSAPTVGAPRMKATRTASTRVSNIRAAANHLVLGIDIGGSGIKGAPVDLHEGRLASDRLRIDTPQPSTPEACGVVVNDIVRHFSTMIAAKGPVGCTYPGVVWDGITHTAANMDHGWLERDADAFFEEACKRPFTVINDAQAAVLAEIRYGAARGAEGLVLMLTFGTGIGSGLAYRGVAIPGIEFGHLRMEGNDAERFAAASVRDRENLSYKKWTERVNAYLARVEAMIWPEVIVLGGAVVGDAEKWVPKLKTRTPVVVAELGNDAGIVGAAIAATAQTNRKR